LTDQASEVKPRESSATREAGDERDEATHASSRACNLGSPPSDNASRAYYHQAQASYAACVASSAALPSSYGSTQALEARPATPYAVLGAIDDRAHASYIT